MSVLGKEFPLNIKLSFHKIIQEYEDYIENTTDYDCTTEKEMLEEIKSISALKEGFEYEDQLLKKYEKPIQKILDPLFPFALEKNEIKAAGIPLNNKFIRLSTRLKKILDRAGKNFNLEMRDIPDDEFYIMGCCIILAMVYGKNVDFKRSFFYDIPDENGLVRYYSVLYNIDYCDIVKTDKAIDITDEDFELLVDQFDNVEIWKEKFPPGSWELKGFVILNLFDSTIDASVSELKTILLGEENQEDAIKFQTIFRSIFDLPNLEIGYTDFYEKGKMLRVDRLKKVKSYLLNNENEYAANELFCEHSFEKVINKGKPFIISNVDKMVASGKDVPKFLEHLHEQNIQSIIIAPVISDGEILGVAEVVSYKKYELNSINANKLDEIMPYIISSLQKSKSLEESHITEIVKRECTSIHESLYWRFEDEAREFYQKELLGEDPNFKDIVFDNVIPLYGQIDIKNSSVTRNQTVQTDLMDQLEKVTQILIQSNEKEALPVYEELLYRSQRFIKELKKGINSVIEQDITDFLHYEVLDCFQHLATLGTTISSEINAYNEEIKEHKGVYYRERKKYDDSVGMINKKMASIIDDKQEEAQEMYPHFFERYKTDGIEHSMYIGESLVQNKPYHKLYLDNLRLWQLQTMCEMEQEYEQYRPNLPIPLKVASLILVYSVPMSIRFRTDEKRFDVDGAYNARYEIIKKRVDKAHIKGTDERITQDGKLTIVYSHKTDEEEYLRYVRFLQVKNYLHDEIEIVELEDLQGVSGLKAIRVKINYDVKKNQKTFTYKQLMEELE
ncbi:hypothetical protein UJ101_00681 [Flavobacteriaceae bacterium UJ101]|nr:hypothetical protein UJ101_00681 [Flavobacteriaceae bacterium UJ101]